ncbi:mandelate racemase/muconate lactonizing enzyme family protein [Saccharopolyspora sp. K220]|uniref:mandelate racemase/muconate lactonizing enzyme family protein n=1 Tax=Saccharopolyspora soli TaxID=2926618 RepID=UPI001F5755E6|nr:mandelate racemase/muconate lactonizing enzyme family protein [Saccharopolyspora soli]MCI2417854.1 mandelate racemase/muconate lactonizing enzyme family protein [Saccharopolyspora soli]
MKITDLRCAVLGGSPIVRLITDEGIDGYGQIESAKPYLKPVVEMYRDFLVGEDPTDVEHCMLKIRRFAGFKPWGSAVSAIELALWDITGKAAGLPVYKLLGGKVRDRVRVYNGGVRPKMTGHTPEDYAASMRQMKQASEGFTLIKQGVAFHGQMAVNVPGFSYGELRTGPRNPNRGGLTEHGFNHVVECVTAMKEVLGDEVGLALDMGPGWSVADAIRVARALEPLQIAWLEDLLTGDYVPWVHPELYREVTVATSTPIHTGEQIYLRHNFKQLIDTQAVRVIGPDPCDVGGIAELKWIAEYADLHGISIAPHGVLDGLIGLAALVQVSATLPDNFIAFEYPVAEPNWWYSIVKGLPDPIVRDGFIEVWDRPGLGVEFIVEEARRYLEPEDAGFFDD